MIRKLLLVLRLLREAPANPVFRLVLLGRTGWASRLAILLLVVGEISYLLWASKTAGGWDDGWLYVILTMLPHAVMMPFLMVGAAWAFSRPFAAAQKEDLWLTQIPPRQVVFGAMLPPALAALFVILVIPVILLLVGLILHFPTFFAWNAQLLTGDLLRPRGGGLFSGSGEWMTFVLTTASVTIYGVMAVVLFRFLMEALIRKTVLSLWIVLRALFSALTAGLLLLGVILIVLSLIDFGRWDVEQAFQMCALTLVATTMALVATMAGAWVALRQYPDRRWFAGVVSSPLDDEDWLASEKEAEGSSASRRFGFSLSLNPSFLMILPRVGTFALLGACVAGVVFGISMNRHALFHETHRLSHDVYAIPTVLLSTLVGGMLAFRWGGLLGMRRPIPRVDGRIDSSIRTAALVTALCGHMLIFSWLVFVTVGPMTYSLGLALYIVAFGLITMLPMWLTLCMMACLLQTPSTRRWTSLAVIVMITGLLLSMWYPGFWWSRVLALTLIIVAATGWFYWMGGGSYGLFQALHDRDRTLLPADDRTSAITNESSP